LFGARFPIEPHRLPGVLWKFGEHAGAVHSVSMFENASRSIYRCQPRMSSSNAQMVKFSYQTLHHSITPLPSLLYLPLDQPADLRRLNFRRQRLRRAFTGEKRAQRRVRFRPPVRAFHQAGIQRDDIHQHPKPQPLAQQPPQNLQFYQRYFRVQEQLHRVKPGFAMNIHTPRKIRRPGVLQPVIIKDLDGMLIHYGN